MQWAQVFTYGSGPRMSADHRFSRAPRTLLSADKQKGTPLAVARRAIKTVLAKSPRLDDLVVMVQPAYSPKSGFTTIRYYRFYPDAKGAKVLLVGIVKTNPDMNDYYLPHIAQTWKPAGGYPALID